MVQAAVLDGLFLDLFSPFDDGGVTPVVSVGGCDVTNALMVTLVIVMIDEGAVPCSSSRPITTTPTGPISPSGRRSWWLVRGQGGNKLRTPHQ